MQLDGLDCRHNHDNGDTINSQVRAIKVLGYFKILKLLKISSAYWFVAVFIVLVVVVATFCFGAFGIMKLSVCFALS